MKLTPMTDDELRTLAFCVIEAQSATLEGFVLMVEQVAGEYDEDVAQRFAWNVRKIFEEMNNNPDQQIRLRE